MPKKYDSSDIEVLKGLEPIRRRPAMYLGGEPNDPIIQNELIKQSLCHAIDEHIEGNTTEIHIAVNASHIVVNYDASMSLKHSEDRACAAEIIMTRLHACQNYKKNISVGDKYCGVGITVVNALSSTFKLETRENGILGTQTYKNGEPIEKFKYIKNEGADFTRFEIYPNPSLCKKLVYDRENMNEWMVGLNTDFPDLVLEIELKNQTS